MAGTSAAAAPAPATADAGDQKSGAPAAGDVQPKADDKTPAAGAGDGTAQPPAKPTADGKGKEKPAADPKGKDAPDGAAKGAPEKYDLAVPDGAGEYLDADTITQFEAFARANDWTNEEANDALEEHADLLAQQSAAFRAVTEKDPTYGGEKLAETQRQTRRVLDRFAPADDPLGAELRRDLARSGFGNKLSVVSFLARVGKAMAEDQPDAGAQGAKPADSGKKPLEDTLYK